MIKLERLGIDGIYKVIHPYHHDGRGKFIKVFQRSWFENMGLESDFAEVYYSVSKKNVIRGMHFQNKPYDHVKMVHVVHGEILDVILDLRRSSPSFGKYVTVNLSDADRSSIYISKGFGHGFLTLSKEAVVLYKTSSEYNPRADTGIRWDSFGFNWLGIDEPIISERDNQLISLLEYTEYEKSLSDW